MRERNLRDCFRTLGLPPSAGPAEIKRAFRRLVKRHHPDLRHGRTDRAEFVRILEAYTHLRRELHLETAEDNLRPCPSCGEPAELLDGADGRPACDDCLLGTTRRSRLLPKAFPLTVRHIPTIMFLTAGVGCLYVAFVRNSRAFGAASLVFGLLALVGLAATCLIIKYTRR